VNEKLLPKLVVVAKAQIAKTCKMKIQINELKFG
jgi:hypothetical protein